MECRRCHREDPDDARFCGGCAARLEKVVPYTGNDDWRSYLGE